MARRLNIPEYDALDTLVELLEQVDGYCMTAEECAAVSLCTELALRVRRGERG